MVGKYLTFGAVEKEHVVDAHTTEDGTKVEQADVFIVIASQSMAGIETSIIGPLQEVMEAAGDRPVIILNPDLVDKISSQGQQSVRGRKDRIDFADSFKTIWHFQNIYLNGTKACQAPSKEDDRPRCTELDTNTLLMALRMDCETKMIPPVALLSSAAENFQQCIVARSAIFTARPT